MERKGETEIKGRKKKEKINTASASQEEGMRTEEIGSHPMAN